MTFYTASARGAIRATPSPFDPDQRHRADFARAAVFAEFGHRGWALDQVDFEDRKPIGWPEPSEEREI